MRVLSAWVVRILPGALVRLSFSSIRGLLFVQAGASWESQNCFSSIPGMRLCGCSLPGSFASSQGLSCASLFHQAGASWESPRCASLCVTCVSRNRWHVCVWRWIWFWLRRNTLLPHSFGRVLWSSIRDGCRNEFHECRRCKTTDERMAGTSVKLRFGFCDADIKAAPSRHFHHHPCLWPASPHAEAVISKRWWYVTKCKTSPMTAKQACVCNWANLESDLIFCQLFIVDDICVRILVLCIDTRCNWLCLNNLCLLMGLNCRPHRRRAAGRDRDERDALSWRTFFFHWCCCGFVRSKYLGTGCSFHCHECFQLNHLR